MRKIAFCVALAVAATGYAIDISWKCDFMDMQVHEIEAYHGEDIVMMPDCYENGSPVHMGYYDTDPKVYWQTQDMGDRYWVTNATIEGYVDTRRGAMWRNYALIPKEMDTGADLVRGFWQLTNNTNSRRGHQQYRIAFVIRYKDSPGTNPHVVDIPRRELDFDTVTVSNPPYYTKAEADAAVAAAEARSAAKIAAATNAIVTSGVTELAIAAATSGLARADWTLAEIQAATNGLSGGTIAAQTVTKYEGKIKKWGTMIVVSADRATTNYVCRPIGVEARIEAYRFDDNTILAYAKNDVLMNPGEELEIKKLVEGNNSIKCQNETVEFSVQFLTINRKKEVKVVGSNFNNDFNTYYAVGTNVELTAWQSINRKIYDLTDEEIENRVQTSGQMRTAEDIVAVAKTEILETVSERIDEKFSSTNGIENVKRRIEWGNDGSLVFRDDDDVYFKINNGGTIENNVYPDTDRFGWIIGGNMSLQDVLDAKENAGEAATYFAANADYALTNLTDAVTLRSGEIGNLTTNANFTVMLDFADNGRSGDALLYLVNSGTNEATLTVAPTSLEVRGLGSDWLKAEAGTTNLFMFSLVKTNTVIVSKQEVK